ncbi:trimethylamine methyltransferase family protein [Gemmobacter serpentinus]|uniref:trimethylamine methyltransferase family protein n=1 Tax=Gemmobacter serpentinus TaxID=2652247 RepID=UPI00124D5FF8|nr:trimethylamine methyltransferase family protein [Gemmobacter serpentinus]
MTQAVVGSTTGGSTVAGGTGDDGAEAGRGERRARPPVRDPGLDQRPWGPARLSDPPLSPLSPEGEAAILAAVLHLLSETGVDFGSTDLARQLRAAGCRVTGSHVRMPADFVTEMLGRVPARFTITPRNAARALHLGEGQIHFGPISSATHVWDLERGKRIGDFAAFRDMIRLSQMFNCVHFMGGYPVEPADIPVPERHLRCMAEMLRLTDKTCHAYALNPAQAEESMEMVRLAANLSPSEFAAAPRMFTNINPVSPLRQEAAVMEAALRFARNGQPVCVTAFAVAGATAPASTAGAVVLALAEALSAVVALQWLVPGTPVMLGALIPIADGLSGAQVYSGPASARMIQMIGQMCRRFGLPFRASGGCTAAIPDGQSIWEGAQALEAAQRSGATMVYHAAGWLEGGLTASPEKFLMDCEILQRMARYEDPDLTATDPVSLAVAQIEAAVRGVAGFAASGPHPGGTGFLADLRPYEGRQQEGGIWTSERAHRLAARLLDEAQDPPLDHAAQEALARFEAAARLV